MKEQDTEISTMNKTYTKEYCDSLALAYGPDMMSGGGPEEIDLILEGIDLTGKDILDFGSGLGGVAFHLAKKYNANVTGIEINPEMIEVAKSNTPESIKHKVSFVLSDGKPLPFSNEKFDVIISKEVIVHLNQPQRDNIFQEFNRVLRKDGKIAIVDFLSPKEIWAEEIKQLMETEALVLYARTPSEYISFIKKANFTNVNFQDRSKFCALYNDEIISRLSSDPIKSEFTKKHGKETWEEHLEGYKNIAAALKNGSVIIVKFTATK